jgi:hypothetical protein
MKTCEISVFESGTHHWTNPIPGLNENQPWLKQSCLCNQNSEHQPDGVGWLLTLHFAKEKILGLTMVTLGDEILLWDVKNLMIYVPVSMNDLMLV